MDSRPVARTMEGEIPSDRSFDSLHHKARRFEGRDLEVALQRHGSGTEHYSFTAQIPEADLEVLSVWTR